MGTERPPRENKPAGQIVRLQIRTQKKEILVGKERPSETYRQETEREENMPRRNKTQKTKNLESQARRRNEKTEQNKNTAQSRKTHNN